ncbi:MAG: preprotein translocase subunit YajC [Acidobacteriota bacterium]
MHHLSSNFQAFWLQQATPAPAGPLGPLVGFLPMILIVGVFYVLIFMPMQKEKKKQAAMLASLESGKEVVTSGGIVGTIVSVNPDTLILRIRPDNVKLQIARSAVSSVMNADVAKVDDKK